MQLGPCLVRSVTSPVLTQHPVRAQGRNPVLSATIQTGGRGRSRGSITTVLHSKAANTQKLSPSRNPPPAQKTLPRVLGTGSCHVSHRCSHRCTEWWLLALWQGQVGVRDAGHPGKLLGRTEAHPS